MTPENCIQDPDIQAVLERSNIERDAWQNAARQLDFLFSQSQGKHQAGHIEEVSRIEAYRKPDGSTMGSVTHLLVLLFPGLILSRKAGVFKKRAEIQEFPYNEFTSGTFVPKSRKSGVGE
jgi:hypothetical protein